MIPSLIICGGEVCGEKHSQLPFYCKATGVRKIGFRFLCHWGEEGRLCRRVNLWGLTVFCTGLAVFVTDGDRFIITDQRSEEPLVEDYPAPPLPGVDDGGEIHWSRLIVEEERGVRLVAHNAVGPEPPSNDLLYETPYFAAALLATRYDKGCLKLYMHNRSEWHVRCSPPLSSAYLNQDPRFPGSGKLVGEEFRVVLPEVDYLRLVGRGGDEYIAWDFVLGVLDTGEWILMADDGLYVARRLGEIVIVERPYDGPVYEVRGPPKAYAYPVVATKTLRLTTGGGSSDLMGIWLRWPLRTINYVVRELKFLNVFAGWIGPCCVAYEV